MNLNSHKPYLLYTTPRSGSTPIFEALSELCFHLYGHESLSEYFNWDYVEAWDEDDQIKILKEDEALVWPSQKGLETRVKTRAQAVKELRYKLNLLRKYPCRYSLKVFTAHISANTAPEFLWLIANYHWFFLERKDLLAQLLSNLIATERGIWYEDRPEKLADGSLTAKRIGFERFRFAWDFYRQTKHILGPKRILYYEDYCQMGPHDFFSDLGFKVPKECKFERALGVPIQNGERKLELFTNQDEILSWFKEL
ncbi:MAG: hypothetical protein K2Q18_08245 [Bdellovibrionales bacterium]|nr:hypothetical protein [Bdellovibrionales bacterium]